MATKKNCEMENIRERIAKIPVDSPDDLVLCKMSHEEAKVFAGECGMNAILVKDGMIQLARIDKDMNFTYNTLHGQRTRPITDEHTIYWIGGKDSLI